MTQPHARRFSALTALVLALAAAASESVFRARVSASPAPPPTSCTFNQATPQVVPLATNFGGILIDSACQHVYLSNTSENRIEVYSLQTLSLEAPIAVGAAPVGLDTTADGTLLYVANMGEHTVSVVDLGTRAQLRKIAVPFDANMLDTPYGIAIANNGRAIVTTTSSSFGSVYQIQLSNDQVTLRGDFNPGGFPGSTSFQTRVAASGDRSTIGLVEAGNSGGSITKYVAATNSFVKKQLGQFVFDVSLDFTGSRWFVGDKGDVLDSTLKMTGLVTPTGGAGAGVVHPSLPLAYRPSGTKVEILNLNTYLKVGEVDLGASASAAATGKANFVGRGDLSDDGTVLAVITDTGFSIVKPSPAAPERINLIGNGRFEAGIGSWTPSAQPDVSYITASALSGSLQFNRLAGSSEADVSQFTGQPLPAGAPIQAQFGLGNSSSVSRTIRVVLADGDFSELKTCSFVIPPGAALATYRMHAVTTESWTNASIHFYADTPGSDGGFNVVDNVFLTFDSGAALVDDCVAPSSVPAGSCVLSGGAPGFVPASSTFSAIRVDDSCRFVYALDRSQNQVTVYSLSDRTFRDPIAVGSSPVDFDISPDGSTMFVANSAGSNVSVVDLRQVVETAKIPIITMAKPGGAQIDRNFIPNSIAVAGNGKVLITAAEFCCTTSDLQEIVIATGAVARRSDYSVTLSPRWLQASDDRSTVAVIGTSVSNGPVVLYRSATDSMSTQLNLNDVLRDVAINASGTRIFAMPSGKIADGTPAVVGTIPGLSGVGSTALHPTLGLAYHADSTHVSLLSLATLSEVGQIPLGDDVSTATYFNGIGRMDLSPDGRVLAVITKRGFSVIEPFASGPPNHLELLRNGGFAAATDGWQTFAAPDPGYLDGGVNGGVFELNRVAPLPGESSQATIFQNTGVPLPTGAPIRAQFDLGNSSTARKRISVLLVDANFSDVSVCTFWLQPNSPLATYQMSSHTTRPWTNASIYFYAATAGADSGFSRIDNVSLSFDDSVTPDQTNCVDPTAPAASNDPDGPDLLVNGDFASGTPDSWTTFGTLTSQVSSGVFEFIRPTSTPPAGVVLQPTGAAVAAGEIVTSTFELGNSSSSLKRVTVLVHDLDLSDLSACTFWLEPGQALSQYTMRTFTTKAWSNATVSFYASTIDTDGWARLDNATLRRTPSAVLSGTECVEPGASGAAPASAPRSSAAASSTAPSSVSAIISSSPTVSSAKAQILSASAAAMPEVPVIQPGRGPNAPASVTLSARLTGAGSAGQIQLSVDGERWETVALVEAGDDWTRILIDVSAWSGQSVMLRFLANDPADFWFIRWDERQVLRR